MCFATGSQLVKVYVETIGKRNRIIIRTLGVYFRRPSVIRSFHGKTLFIAAASISYAMDLVFCIQASLVLPEGCPLLKVSSPLLRDRRLGPGLRDCNKNFRLITRLEYILRRLAGQNLQSSRYKIPRW
jgi:hypothetical protein